MKTLLLATAFAAFAVPASAGCIVSDPTGTPLNVRSRPNGPILGALYNDTPVLVTGGVVTVGMKVWVNVTPLAPGKRGWVFFDFLSCERS